jgi:RND family efflux transporter MFP subunit
MMWTVVVLIVLATGIVVYLKRSAIFTPAAGGPASATEANATKPPAKVLYWVDPMHPSYKSDKPGKAPDCGMDLVPVYEGSVAPSDLPEGAFLISPEKQQMIGMTYGEISSDRVSKTLRTVGRIAYDETKLSHVHTKVEGWIENVYVDFTGKQIKKGDPLLTVYSPDLLQTQQEYLLALKGRTELSESPFKEASVGAESLYQSARRRLELWDVSDDQIRELERTGKPEKAVPLYSPASGFVLTRNAFPKQRVMPESDLYTVVDLSTIWVLADIYEQDATDVVVGQTATVTLAYLPGRTYKGTINYIYPQVDPTTRTIKVRIEIPNPSYLLKPDMYADVELKIDYGRKLVVPQEAVMDSGSERLVFVALNGGYFEPRKVKLGAKVDNRFIVEAGLKAGERVVTSGNFLIDSESKLKSAAAGMGMPGMSHGGGGGATEKKGMPQEGEPAPQPDHSQHRESGQPAPTPQPEDHSKHQARPQDHSRHQSEQRVSPKVDGHSEHGTGAGDQSRSGMGAGKGRSEHQVAQRRKILYWVCPMDPSDRSDKPGKASCGMERVPKYAD